VTLRALGSIMDPRVTSDRITSLGFSVPNGPDETTKNSPVELCRGIISAARPGSSSFLAASWRRLPPRIARPKDHVGPLSVVAGRDDGFFTDRVSGSAEPFALRGAAFTGDGTGLATSAVACCDSVPTDAGRATSDFPRAKSGGLGTAN
jgi:hypothetical protein